MGLEEPLTGFKGVGEAQAKKFALLGLKTVGDLLDYYPRRYEDYSTVLPTNALQPGPVTVEGVIKQASGRYVRRGLHVTEAVISDEHGSVRLVWFNQPYRAAALKPGRKYFVSGQYELSRQRFVIMNPSVEMSGDLPVNTARILAVYRETKGLTSRQIRLVVSQALEAAAEIPETLPGHIVEQHKLMSRARAIVELHTPHTMKRLELARRRLGFEEVFALSLASLLNKQENRSEKALSIPFDEKLARDFVKHLSFKLTDAQRRAIWRIYLDLQKTEPMNRLLEGDVGSGKTVVAAMAALMPLSQDWQVALMAPTELLARQHADTIHTLLQPLSRENSAVLLVGSVSADQKTRARAAIKDGRAGFIIGTHALIQEQVDMHKLALVIIDEQHRFGVDQRKALMAKAGHMPHVLSMTATPIPRSLALTLYGELDVSVLGEKPAGRQPVVTELVSPNARDRLYTRVDEQLEAGHQAFVVCPLVTDSAAVGAKSAEQVYEELKRKAFKQRRIGLLHGQLKATEKQSVMRKFVEGKLDVLVATTVIEVGVDVPNAAIMIIESAERFGLAQLHQLRGRVGRSDEQGYCYLLTDGSGPPSRRLRALESSHDGFRLAEFDLELRGPGAIYGTSQHGQLDLRIAQLSDVKLISLARASARDFIARGDDLLQYKELAETVTRLRAVTNLN